MIKVLLILAALAIAVMGYFLGNRPLPTLTQSATAGEVNITARYLGDQFEIALDTHSVDLSNYDFLQSVLLKTMNSELSAISATPVSDSPPHHRIYLVTFPKFKLPVTLVINNLGLISQTTLKFDRR